jgi:hypothetical protein
MLTEYETPEFITKTETVWSATTIVEWIHLESTATGFEIQSSESIPVNLRFLN